MCSAACHKSECGRIQIQQNKTKSYHRKKKLGPGKYAQFSVELS